MTERLFCYGTLCVAAIMRQVCGSLPASLPGQILGYSCYSLQGLAYPGVIPAQGERVEGVMYSRFSKAQLARLDAYEGSWYRRMRVDVLLGSGNCSHAWTYVLRPRNYCRLGKNWALTRFMREDLGTYFYQSFNKAYGFHGRDANQSA